MKLAATILALLLALAVAQALLTLVGMALVLALACTLILRPRQTLLLAAEIGLFCLIMAYPWTAVLTAAVLVVGLAILKRQSRRPVSLPELRGLPPLD